MKKPTIFRYYILPIALQTILYSVASILFLKVAFNIHIPELLKSSEGKIMIVAEIILSLLLSSGITLPIQHDKYEHDKHDYQYHQITWDEYLNNKNTESDG